MNTFGNKCCCRTKVKYIEVPVEMPSETWIYGELQDDELFEEVLTFTGTPSPWIPFTGLDPGEFKEVTLAPGLPPSPSAFTILHSGTYSFNLDFSLSNPNGGGTRDMEMSAFVDNAQTGRILKFSVSNFDIGSLTLTGMTQLTAGQTIDIRMRKVSGADYDLTSHRTNYTLESHLILE